MQKDYPIATGAEQRSNSQRLFQNERRPLHLIKQSEGLFFEFLSLWDSLNSKIYLTKVLLISGPCINLAKPSRSWKCNTGKRRFQRGEEGRCAACLDRPHLDHCRRLESLKS